MEEEGVGYLAGFLYASPVAIEVTLSASPGILKAVMVLI
jgi:hypothetical protein